MVKSSHVLGWSRLLTVCGLGKTCLLTVWQASALHLCRVQGTCACKAGKEPFVFLRAVLFFKRRNSRRESELRLPGRNSESELRLSGVVCMRRLSSSPCSRSLTPCRAMPADPAEQILQSCRANACRPSPPPAPLPHLVSLFENFARHPQHAKASLHVRLKDFLGPVTRVKKRKKKLRAEEFDEEYRIAGVTGVPHLLENAPL